MELFDTSGFMPRWRCGDWGGGLGHAAILAHLTIAAIYLAIPMLLLRAVRVRKDLPHIIPMYLFSAFILCCGIGHVINVVIFWAPVYRFLVFWDGVTAIVSLLAFFKLVPTIPKVLAMRAPEELQQECDRRHKVETELSNKVVVLEATEKELRRTNRELANTVAAKRELEQRLKELQACQVPRGETTLSPTQEALARMREATRQVAASLSSVPAPADAPVAPSGPTPQAN